MAYGSVRGQLTRRAALLAGGAVLGGYLTHRFGSKVPSVEGTRLIQPTGGEGTLNDASLLNETPIFRHITVQQNPGQALIARLRNEMAEARAEGRPFNVGAARHSMGGHAIPPGGHAVTFDNGLLETDVGNLIYRVHPGARWSLVITALDPQGMSPKVMQSNNDFGVAASFCVNAHGWAVPHGPMGATVRAFFLLRPDGELLRVSRTEFPELFNLTMGGFGLTGAIVDMEIEMVPNKRLVPTFQRMPARDFAPFFIGAIETGDVNMAYGRLNVDRENFFEEALMVTFREEGDQLDLPPVSDPGFIERTEARVLRSQLMNETGKGLRWWLETGFAPRIDGGEVTRNALFNTPVATLDDRNPTRTDILHEYFVPPARFADFITACQEVIPASYQELLNITLRHVGADRESLLAYAPGPRIAAVMLFSQEMTARAEADHRRMTQELIERVLELGGTYYLPYRPHATPEQFKRAYPRAEEFVARKLEIDPDRLFRSLFWDNYLEGLA